MAEKKNNTGVILLSIAVGIILIIGAIIGYHHYQISDYRKRILAACPSISKTKLNALTLDQLKDLYAKINTNKAIQKTVGSAVAIDPCYLIDVYDLPPTIVTQRSMVYNSSVPISGRPPRSQNRTGWYRFY